MRYISENLQKDLTKKMVILSGPRQSGKTTLARHIASGTGGLYFNWDVRSDQKTIRDIAWDKSAPLVVFDELHKYPKWKNFLKGVYDAHGGKQSILVTGSARLDTFRKSGDALTGRFYHYRLHPVDLPEALRHFNDDRTLGEDECLSRLLTAGGFPESFLNPDDAERLRNNRFDVVVQEDLLDLSRVSSLRGVSLLIELLRERVGSTLNYENLAKDLSVSPPTARAWVELLERLYVIFLVYPYTKNLSRSVRKESKAYFYDCASAYNGEGARLENCVAAALLKYLHYLEDTSGVKGRLCCFRDREKREVDFVVEVDRRVRWIIEVKTDDEALHKNLLYLKERISPGESLQLVKNAAGVREVEGVRIVPLAGWLGGLYDGNKRTPPPRK
ncbi:MAG TPA: ATP-binding protein [Spirochaetota bacterium]|nr:ATP-binding protein [Spirochaetota bacterium]